MSRRLSRLFLVAVLSFSTTAMMSLSYDAEARRSMGSSMGRQSSNVTQQRAPAQAPAANTTARTNQAAAPAAGAAAGAAKSGMSRFLGPLAGIAAGLGIAALLSSLGLGGALLEMLSSMLLIGIVVFAVVFLVRRLRGGSARPATQAAGAQPMMRNQEPAAAWNRPENPAPSAAFAAAPAEVPAAPVDESWFIPGDFDTPTFLANAKQQFVEVQKLWDRGDVEQMRNFLTDDLLAEAAPQIEQRGGEGYTEVVLLNAELLGIEKVADGHLASVRYSGMLREEPGTEAFRFEEVWNLFKADGSGWLLAGIQQIPVDAAS
ncbi:Tim44 domain-containing protein [Alcaligenes endophyticus]|uniref:39S ribosomal protein L45 n=1 Tax=Alcaligenes endophyticus TaxID=1929088 RepID=A0ABT8EG02_9BURK|nr:Tim44-like domain-containing protein [Alcaligenes endophyticus]MCX5590103.1 Tim44-like domain-containing protein [Alcaligenes endophyticus]MDN4120234.1 39S ribosomal protein L45 [Alcaligenes endophyticus]